MVPWFGVSAECQSIGTIGKKQRAVARSRGLLRSETEFRQHLPAVLQIHVPKKEIVYPKYAPYQAVQKMWTIRNRYGHTYAKIFIYPTISPSNG